MIKGIKTYKLNFLRDKNLQVRIKGIKTYKNHYIRHINLYT